MIIKEADNKNEDIEILKNLLARSEANEVTKQKIEQKIKFIQSGIKGEHEAAYEINFHYGAHTDWVVIHDLRIEHEGRVAQIDHILLNRYLDIWVCESKRFSEGVAINDYGEFSMFINGKPRGFPSPFQQNRKHIDVLNAMFDAKVVTLPTRFGFAIRPVIKGLVLVSKNARVTRPSTRVNGIDDLVKVDQIQTRITNRKRILSVRKRISLDTLEKFALRLTDQHIPQQINWHAKFGLTYTPAHRNLSLSCYSCGALVTENVSKFCHTNNARFSGNVYCIRCQSNLRYS